MSSEQWIFGYGSLIWRPAFAFLESRPAYLRGYQRRFWQASPDHRGTPEAPGRVATLIAHPDSICWGMAYRVCGSVASEVLDALDHRERAGYERVLAPLYVGDDLLLDDVLLYIAAPGNPNFRGEEPDRDIAAVIARAHGPSGSNREYLLRLAEALHAMGQPDAHIDSLVALVSD